MAILHKFLEFIATATVFAPRPKTGPAISSQSQSGSSAPRFDSAAIEFRPALLPAIFVRLLLPIPAPGSSLRSDSVVFGMPAPSAPAHVCLG